MLRNSLILGGLLVTFSFALASAQDGDPKENCAGLADSFKIYASDSEDPDLDYATGLVKKGVEDCNDGRFDQGIAEIVTATGLLHDHQKTKLVK